MIIFKDEERLRFIVGIKQASRNSNQVTVILKSSLNANSQPVEISEKFFLNITHFYKNVVSTIEAQNGEKRIEIPLDERVIKDFKAFFLHGMIKIEENIDGILRGANYFRIDSVLFQCMEIKWPDLAKLAGSAFDYGVEHDLYYLFKTAISKWALSKGKEDPVKSNALSTPVQINVQNSSNNTHVSLSSQSPDPGTSTGSSSVTNGTPSMVQRKRGRPTMPLNKDGRRRKKRKTIPKVKKRKSNKKTVKVAKESSSEDQEENAEENSSESDEKEDSSSESEVEVKIDVATKRGGTRSSSNSTLIPIKSNANSINISLGRKRGKKDFEVDPNLNILFMNSTRKLQVYNLKKKETRELTREPILPTRPILLFDQSDKVLWCLGGEDKSDEDCTDIKPCANVVTIPNFSLKTIPRGGYSWVNCQNMLYAKCFFVALIHQRKIITFGGCVGEDTKNAVDNLDLTADNLTNIKWNRNSSNMLHFREKFGAEVIGDNIYLIGGLGQHKPGCLPGSYGPLKTAEVYNFFTKKKSLLAPMKETRSGVRTALLNGKIYAIGGSSTHYNFDEIIKRKSTVEVYDPKKNVWTKGVGLKEPRCEGDTFVHDGKIFAVGGNGTTKKPSIEYFDPESNTWNLLDSNLPSNGIYESVAVVKEDFKEDNSSKLV